MFITKEEIEHAIHRSGKRYNNYDSQFTYKRLTMSDYMIKHVRLDWFEIVRNR